WLLLDDSPMQMSRKASGPSQDGVSRVLHMVGGQVALLVRQGRTKLDPQTHSRIVREITGETVMALVHNLLRFEVDTFGGFTVVQDISRVECFVRDVLYPHAHQYEADMDVYLSLLGGVKALFSVPKQALPDILVPSPFEPCPLLDVSVCRDLLLCRGGAEPEYAVTAEEADEVLATAKQRRGRKGR
ncbi:hypothetical protein KIPB_002406, partial [Kipferlia bialata]